jgi:hypothetical protein
VETDSESKVLLLDNGILTYWPSDPGKIPDLLDFYFTSGISPSYMGIASSYDLSSDHTPVIATFSTEPVNKKTTPRLHNRRTNWDGYRIIIEEAANLNITTYIGILQEAAQQATSTPKPQTRSINIPSEIK